MAPTTVSHPFSTSRSALLTILTMRRHYQHRAISWIAIVAIVLNTLMPMASLAMEASQSHAGKTENSWVEVCTLGQSVWLHLAPDGKILEKSTSKPAGAPFSIQAEHCAYCGTPAHTFALLTTPSLELQPARSDVYPLSSTQQSHCQQTAWLAPAVRAPPVFS